jgi:hypothetical protein
VDRPPHPGGARVRIADDGRDSAWCPRPTVCHDRPLPDQRHLHRDPRIILGGLGYYFCLQSGAQEGSRAGQILGIAAVVFSVISIAISGLTGPPQ